MAAFALRYSTTAITPLTYAPAGANQTTYEGLEFYRPKSNVVSVIGGTKRGRRYQHIKYKQKDYVVVIGADEINDDGVFLEAFWEAKYKYIAVYNGSWGDYQQVVTAGGEFPITFDDDEIFPEVSLVLFCTEPKT